MQDSMQRLQNSINVYVSVPLHTPKFTFHREIQSSLSSLQRAATPASATSPPELRKGPGPTLPARAPTKLPPKPRPRPGSNLALRQNHHFFPFVMTGCREGQEEWVLLRAGFTIAIFRRLSYPGDLTVDVKRKWQ